jgi:hypothetical protein
VGDQREYGAFAAAAATDQRHGLAGGNVQIHIPL